MRFSSKVFPILVLASIKKNYKTLAETAAENAEEAERNKKLQIFVPRKKDFDRSVIAPVHGHDKTTSLHHGIDLGVLSSRNTKSKPSEYGHRRLTPTCSAGSFIECINGYLPDGTTSCRTACNGNCCYGVSACYDFTGNICPDGSCTGLGACKEARIQYVLNSCKKDSACLRANVTLVEDSCEGIESCYEAGFSGAVGYIVEGSCNGTSACSGAAQLDGETVSIKGGSCAGLSSCKYIAQDRGYVEFLDASCTGDFACLSLASTIGNVGKMQNSCTGMGSCGLAVINGDAGDMIDCCQAVAECYSQSGVFVDDKCTSTFNPTLSPTLQPTGSQMPSMSAIPSTNPSMIPSSNPSMMPSSGPSKKPTPLEILEKILKQIDEEGSGLFGGQGEMSKARNFVVQAREQLLADNVYATIRRITDCVGGLACVETSGAHDLCDDLKDAQLQLVQMMTCV